jgi:Flp pilus assembly protein TadG
MRRLASILRRIGRDRRGASIIELALALPVLSIMVVGLVDMASLFSAQLSLQQAAARSLERVQVNGTTTNLAFVKTEAAAAADVPESQVTVETWLECENVKQAATVTICPGTADAAKYVKVTITKEYVPFFTYSPLGTRQTNGNVALSAAASVRHS